MFDSLADQIKQDQKKEASSTERMVKWAVVVVISVLLFGGLVYGVRMGVGG